MKINPFFKKFYDVVPKCNNNCNFNCVICKRCRNYGTQYCYRPYQNSQEKDRACKKLPGKECSLWEHENIEYILISFPDFNSPSLYIDFQIFMNEFCKIESEEN